MTEIEKDILADAIHTAIETEKRAIWLTRIIVAMSVVIVLMGIGYFII